MSIAGHCGLVGGAARIQLSGSVDELLHTLVGDTEKNGRVPHRQPGIKQSCCRSASSMSSLCTSRVLHDGGLLILLDQLLKLGNKLDMDCDIDLLCVHFK